MITHVAYATFYSACMPINTSTVFYAKIEAKSLIIVTATPYRHSFTFLHVASIIKLGFCLDRCARLTKHFLLRLTTVQKEFFHQW